jgi:hypothetical protein
MSADLIQDKWRDEDMDDAAEWQRPYPEQEGPVTLEGLLEFLAGENPDAEDHPETVNVEEVIRRMKEARG